MQKVDFTEFISKHFPPPERKQVSCRAGIITFERGGSIFGKKVLIVLPPHGDLGCWCNGCDLYRTVSDERRDGWTAVEFVEYE